MTENKVNNPIDTDPDPSPNPGATKLRRYWTRGEGALKIKWGVSGDFNRCVRHLRKYVSDPKGLCNVYHRVAVGAPPGKGHVGGKILGWEIEYKRDFSSDSLEKLGKQGHAFRNHNGEWSYPIANAEDLKNAIQAFGRAASGDRERLKRYIEKRARELGKSDSIPDGWSEKSVEIAITLEETLFYAQTLLKLDMSEFTAIFSDDNEKETKDDMQNLEHKNISVSSSGVTETTEDGVVEALVSVTGIVDNVGDIIKPGAYEKTLQKRTAKGVWSHDWNTPVSRVEEIKELLPGDPKLPTTLANGDAWPSDAGALYVKAKFNLETQRGREAFSDVRFFGDQTEWSIGYKVTKNGAEKDDKTGIRTINELDLFEFSPVLFGAASNARSLVGAAKSLFDSEEEFLEEVKGVMGIKDVVVEEHKCDGCNHEEEEEEAVVEDIKVDAIEAETRSQEESLPITAESLQQIKTLYNQLGEVLALFTKETPVVPEFKDNKSLRDAMAALIDGAYDSGVVQEIDDHIIGLEGAIKAMDSASIQSYANDALDEIQAALQDERAKDQDIKDLKALAAAIGEAIQKYESTKPEEVLEEIDNPTEEAAVVDTPKTVQMTDTEWKSFIAGL